VLSPVPLVESAPAKVNLTLRVLGRRPDSYHEIESLVVFADFGDTLSLSPGGALGLDLRGPRAGQAGDEADNLVIKAARALAERVADLKVGTFHLEKILPVAAGLGGGSADAGAALRLLARANGLALDDPRLGDAARVTGADVPVCLDPRPRLMRGIGEVLSAPLALPPMPALLVNPGVALSTNAVFAGWSATASRPVNLDLGGLGGLGKPPNFAQFLQVLALHANDLEIPAIKLSPLIAKVLVALRALPGCGVARMSGSGASCFALFASVAEANAAAALLHAKYPDWWLRSTVLAG
jgi:4-diphosphocytidyl-2-C-methyl-D-erythritol kinase